MIDESLFRVNHIGKDGFVWWIGQVANRKSWSGSGIEYGTPNSWPARCKVRIIGYHSFRKGDLPDEDLPWANVVVDPAFGSAQGAEGCTVNLQGGEVCFGFFVDGDDAQQPVVIGLLPRPPGVKNEEEDVGFSFQPFSGVPSTGVPATKLPTNPEANTAVYRGTPVGGTPTDSRIDNYFNVDSGANANLVGFGITTNFAGTFVGFGSTSPIYSSAFSQTNNDKLFTFYTNLGNDQFIKKTTFEYTKPSPCDNNLIGQISSTLQGFIDTVSSFQKYANSYIDPVLNEIRDIGNTIKSTANQIGSFIRLIINTLRSSIIKCIVSLIKKYLSRTNAPSCTQSFLSLAFEKVINTVFCLFERIIPGVLDYIEDLLGRLVDSVFSAPACAVDQWVSGLLAYVMDTIDQALDPVLSGIEWLSGGLSNIFGALNQASNLARQIIDFISCVNTECRQPATWSSRSGPSLGKADDWAKTVSNINSLNSLVSESFTITDAIDGLSLYGQSSSYDNCNNLVNNLDELNRCIPPTIDIYGDGVGAKLIPIVGSNRKIISVQIVSPGFGYTYPPILTVKDKNNNGSGAILLSYIDSKGSIDRVVVVNQGENYCQNDISDLIGISTSRPKPPLDCGEEEPEEETYDFYLSLNRTKYNIFRGESFEIEISSSDKKSPSKVAYIISGINQEEIQQNLNDIINLVEGKVTIKIDTIKNDELPNKELVFKLIDYDKSVSFLLSTNNQTTDDDNDDDGGGDDAANKVYALSTSDYYINEGTPFTVTLQTSNVDDGTIVPFRISGISEGLIDNLSSYNSFTVNDNKAEITFRTNKGTILNNQIFVLELIEQKISISVLINKIIDSNTINSFDPKVCLTELVVIAPGYGYSQGDTVTDGINNFNLVISPQTGSIFGVEKLTESICGYPDVPVMVINTSTGVGGVILAVTKLDERTIEGTPTSSISVVDCI